MPDTAPLSEILEYYDTKLTQLENTGRKLPLILKVLFACNKVLKVPFTRGKVQASLSSSSLSNEDFIKLVLSVLFIRDKVQASLSSSSLSNEDFIKLVTLDDRLKKAAKSVTRKVNLESWRASLHPPENNWWWFLDSVDCLDPFGWLWQFFTLLVLTASLSLLVEISNRFLKGGIDWIGSFAVVSQGIVTLFAAGTVLTTAGQIVIEKTLANFRIPKHHWQQAKLWLSLALLGLLCGIWSFMPALAAYFNEQGTDRYNQGRAAEALLYFERATNLDPTNLKAHYNLGQLYEELQDLDKAKIQYQIAAKGQFSAGYNALGRLALQSNKLEDAAALLQSGLKIVHGKKVQYGLLKNLGWVRLKQKDYTEAEKNLRQAISLETAFEAKQQPAGAHCLLAQVLEKKTPPSSARQEWQLCLERTKVTRPEEDTWRRLARNRLNKP
jgi:tetratricopeptide (TPR) repeat protein